MSNLPTLYSFDNPEYERPDFTRDDRRILEAHYSRINNDWIPSIGSVFKSQNFYRHTMKRANAVECTFDTCNFTKVAGTGGGWSKSKFVNCDFTESNYEFSDFSGSILSGGKIIGASFSSSKAKDSNWNGVEIKGTSLTQIDFSGATINACDIQSCTLEGSIFKNSLIKDMVLNNLNIEYCDFLDSKFENVSLSMMQLPYIFGITPEQIKSGSVSICTDDTTNYPLGILPWESFFDLVNTIKKYFESNADFFPLANLYLSSGMDEEFIKALELGMKTAIIENKYREIKFFSKLAFYSKKFSREELKGLYELIESIHFDHGNLEEQSHEYKINEGEIRHYLLHNMQPQGFGLKIAGTNMGMLSDIELAKFSAECLETSLRYLDLEFDLKELSFSEGSCFLELSFILQNRNNTSVDVTSTKQNTSSYQKVMLVLAVVGVLFSGANTMANINDKMGMLNNKQYEQIDEKHQQLKKQYDIKNYIFSESGVMLLKGGADDVIMLSQQGEKLLSDSTSL